MMLTDSEHTQLYQDCDREQIDKLAARIRKSGWAVPCGFLVSVVEPFGTIASQALLMLAPFLSNVEHLADVVQDREKMAYLRIKLQDQDMYHSEEK